MLDEIFLYKADVFLIIIYELFICWDIYIFCHMSIWKIMIIRVDSVYIHSKNDPFNVTWLVSIYFMIWNKISLYIDAYCFMIPIVF